MAETENIAEDGLLGYLDELAEKLRNLVPMAIRDGEVEAIHQARVTTRRLKAAIDLFDSVIAEKQKEAPKKLLKRLRRRLGALRDADVMIEHLAQLGKARRWGRPAAWIASRMRARRDEAFRQTREKVEVADVLGRLGQLWGVREQVREAMGEPAAVMLRDSLLDQLHQFEHAADGLFGMEKETGVRQDPHELRIAGKALRYTLELAKADGHPLPKDVLRQFKSLQEALGLWHDYVVLGQEAMREDLAADLALHDSMLHREVLALAVEAARRADARLRQFGTQWQASGREIRRIIEELFPAPAIVPPAMPPAPEYHALNDARSTTDS